MRRFWAKMSATGAVFAAILVAGGAAIAQPQHAIAMHGSPLYKPGFSHFSYADPDAPKGGTLKLAAIGSFDSVNPMIVRGTAGLGAREHVFESLMARSYDEPFSLYGLIAESIETPDDRSWVAFTLRPEAKFSDGTPITVEDVIFSIETLREKGRPNHRYYYSKVEKIERPDARTIKLIFGEERDREMPLIMGLMPILPKHIYEGKDFEKTTLEPMVGSGPYVMSEIKPGTRITYKRDPDYWGKDLAVNRGLNNPDEIVYDYFRDTNASFEAFKAGLYDARPESDPARWVAGFDFTAVQKGDVRKLAFKPQTPSGMRAFVFNTRRPVFQEKKVREALIYAFDFEWVNKNLFYGAYERVQSYYDGSELSSHGRPASEKEKALLAPYMDAVDPAILANGYQAPVSDGSGRNRENRRKAIMLLQDAGWTLQDGQMKNAAGEPLSFEILVSSPDDERLALNYAQSLKGIGVAANVRNVDSTQYEQRRQTYDFDMILNFWYASLSPGNEQSFYWGSEAARTDGSRNYMGAENPAIDAMIEAVLAARSREDFVAAIRALDRVLLSGYYVVPLYYQPEQWVALWDKVKVPEKTSLYGYRSDAWWVSE